MYIFDPIYIHFAQIYHNNYDPNLLIDRFFCLHPGSIAVKFVGSPFNFDGFITIIIYVLADGFVCLHLGSIAVEIRGQPIEF